MSEHKELNDHHQRKLKLNQAIKDYMLYTGFALAIISAISYIGIVFVMIRGFEEAIELQNQLVFSILGVAVGLVIAFSLKQQGIAFAKSEDNSKQVMKDYYEALNKSKQEKDLHTIGYYLFISTIKDIIFKGTGVAVTTYFIINISINGGGNWSLLFMAISNILFFIGLGLIALSTFYDKYINEHLPVIEALTKKIKERQVIKDSEAHIETQLETIPFCEEDNK